MAADVSTTLPDLNLQDQSVVTIDSGNAAVKITALVVHGWQSDDPGGPDPLLPIYLQQNDGALINPANFGGPAG